MKRTLIALITLSSMAMGVDVLKDLDEEVLTLSTLTANGSETITSGNQALNFEVDGKTSLSSYIITFGFEVTPPADAKDPWLRLVDNTYGIKTIDASTMVAVNNDWADQVEGTTFTINTTDTFAFTFSGSNVYLSNLSTGTYVVGTPDAPGKWALISGTSRIYTNSQANQLQFGQVADLTGLSESQILEVVTTGSYTVPEPTTATLSLLALAGLAARRRRATR